MRANAAATAGFARNDVRGAHMRGARQSSGEATRLKVTGGWQEGRRRGGGVAAPSQGLRGHSSAVHACEAGRWG